MCVTSNRVLFLCTGNYYRSRFAEAVFNHHAVRRKLRWSAFSRGLGVVPQPYRLSPLALKGLLERGIDPEIHTSPEPIQVDISDFESARLHVALKEREHRPKMQSLFPDWEARIDYWHVHDLDGYGPEEALPEIERRVLQILHRISRGDFS